MSKIHQPMKLSLVKPRLSEVVRKVRRTGEPVVITVDGEPVAQIAPIESKPRDLSVLEVANHRALMNALARIPRPGAAFDAIDLLAEGRR